MTTYFLGDGVTPRGPFGQILADKRIYQLGMSSFVPVILHESSGFVFGGNYPQDEETCPPGCHYASPDELRAAIEAARENPDALPQQLPWWIGDLPDGRLKGAVIMAHVRPEGKDVQ